MVRLVGNEQLNAGELVINGDRVLMLLEKEGESRRALVLWPQADYGKTVTLGWVEAVVHLGKLKVEPQDNGSFVLKLLVPN